MPSREQRRIYMPGGRGRQVIFRVALLLRLWMGKGLERWFQFLGVSERFLKEQRGWEMMKSSQSCSNLPTSIYLYLFLQPGEEGWKEHLGKQTEVPLYQRSSEKQTGDGWMDRQIYRHRQGRIFVIGNVLHSYREVPLSAVYKLENQETSGVIQSESKGLRIRSPIFQGRRRGVSAQVEESEFTLLLPFCSFQALNGLDGAHLCWGR